MSDTKRLSRDHDNIGPPPEAAQKPHQYRHHGITVDDPFAWLRDAQYPDVNHPEILAYLEAENAYFDAYMSPIKSSIDALFGEMKARRPATDASVPYTKNGYRYQWRFNKHAQYRTWYRAPAEPAQLNEDEAWEVLLDEGTLAKDKPYFDLGALAVSPDNSKLAYSIDVDGSERYTLHIIDLATRQPLSPAIVNTIDTPIWSADSSALMYVVVNAQWQPLEVYQHQLNQIGADRLVFAEPDPTYRVSIDLSQSERYLLINSAGHSDNEVYTLPRDQFDAPPQCLAKRQDQVEYHVDHGNNQFVIRSNLRHANFDLFTTPEHSRKSDDWHLWIEGDKHTYLTGHLMFTSHLIVEERINGLENIRIVGLDSTEHHIKFPEATYSVNLASQPHADSGSIRLSYTSLVTPQTVYEYDLYSRSLTALKVQTVPTGYAPETFVTTRRMACARDGVQVPISLVYHQDTPLDGTAPLYLYAYGAYGYATPPAFSASRLSLLERGFIYAIAHIRGGDDLGYQWYLDGKLDKRTNTFNDFVDCARHLIANGITQPGRIAIAGGSAGGELMGAAVNQAPELWGAVAAHVPFVDVLNTMLDETLPLTPPEWGEWGNPITDAKAFLNIQAYSPYDQLKPGHYPPMLVTAGLNDPRVTYWEPAKYVAKLRTLKKDRTVLLLKTNMAAGHGGQSGRFEALKELAEEYAFMIQLLQTNHQLNDR